MATHAMARTCCISNHGPANATNGRANQRTTTGAGGNAANDRTCHSADTGAGGEAFLTRRAGCQRESHQNYDSKFLHLINSCNFVSPQGTFILSSWLREFASLAAVFLPFWALRLILVIL
jgi:hypothetical protein